jgi:hypothetical protein
MKPRYPEPKPYKLLNVCKYRKSIAVKKRETKPSSTKAQKLKVTEKGTFN